MYTKKIIGEFELTGLKRDGTKASSHQARQVVCFVDSARSCKFTYDGRGGIVMELRNRRVLFTKHHKFNYYKAETLNGKELRVTVRRTTGKLKCLEKVALPDDVIERLLAEGYYHGVTSSC